MFTFNVNDNYLANENLLQAPKPVEKVVLEVAVIISIRFSYLSTNFIGFCWKSFRTDNKPNPSVFIKNVFQSCSISWGLTIFKENTTLQQPWKIFEAHLDENYFACNGRNTTLFKRQTWSSYVHYQRYFLCWICSVTIKIEWWIEKKKTILRESSIYWHLVKKFFATNYNVV